MRTEIVLLWIDLSAIVGLRAPMEKVVQTVQMLCEGVGIRAISRLTGLNQETVLNILEMAGQKATRLLDQQILNIESESVQCDEVFAFVQKKEFNNKDNDPEVGTQYTYNPFACGRES